MIEVIHVSSRGQIVIPERVRKRLKITPGSRLVLIEKEDTLILQREESIAKHLEHAEHKEVIGWMMHAEKSLRNVWDNPEDEQEWKKYL